MTEEQADNEAERLNLEVGQRVADREVDNTFYVPVQLPEGDWTVDKRGEPQGWFGRLIDAIPWPPFR